MEVRLNEQQYAVLTKEKQRYAKRIENMYLDKLDGRITTSEYDKLYNEFRDKIKAYDLFLSSEIEEKRQIIKLTLQNLALDGKKVQFQVQKPFDTIINYADSQLWGG